MECAHDGAIGREERCVARANLEHTRHLDRRVNIPTEELRDFVVEEERQPKTLRYERDPSLDPQLVWSGKDDQDGRPLEVAAVPIYIQEKLHPRAIIEDLRKESRGPRQELLFDDFDGLPFGEMVEFYEHDQRWTNRMILGDSLYVMASLAEKERLRGKVQAIYIDPPYGIRFGSNWQVSTRRRDVRDGRVEDATRQPEQIRAYRDTWERGIHSYLTYMRDRLVVARDLLTETGSVFVQIGDENVHLVRSLMDEVYGSVNFVAEIVVEKTASSSEEYLDRVADYLLWYGKNKDVLKYRQLYLDKKQGRTGASYYRFAELPNGERRQLVGDEDRLALPPGSKLYSVDALTSQTNASTTRYLAEFKGRLYESGKRQWATPPAGMRRLIAANRVQERANSIGYVRFYDDFPVLPLRNNWTDTGTGSFTDAKVYVVQTGAKVVERCILMTTDPGDLVLDPTCGSGTTAYVAEQWGRRWITIDTSRVALALTRTRLMAARYPYYILADSREGRRKEAELTSQAPADLQSYNDVRKGFVYRRVPHVTLKSIANNPDIHEGMTREEIDSEIARHAEQEILYDQPYEDSKRIRVTGPFTVESLSPHRVLSANEDLPTSVEEAQKEQGPSFETMILDNLRKSGVQNTVREERLEFTRLEPYAGRWIQAEGEYNDQEGRIRRAAIAIGPEHGTVGPEMVKGAAKEAVQGIGFDVLVICGFSFDPHVSEEAKRYGRLQVLIARMNPDLAMGDDLLKKTGSGNLFTVFGEPDLGLRCQDGKVVVELRGVDLYDPTTGDIRSHSTDDIACWFIDTDYDEESFFVRHAYFTGAQEPYDRLRRALRAEIDEAAWASLYSTVSRPFDPPASGKIAVKAINHYGDEVLKVYDVEQSVMA